MADISGWASRLLFPDRNKSEFDKFVQEVNDESAEHMSVQVSSMLSITTRKLLFYDVCFIVVLV